ncbi:MAG: hypothetical protein KDE20_25605 [Caldilineaceae bacterium]|nr:hypothetical protein [Caldilineaceae bacterium]
MWVGHAQPDPDHGKSNHTQKSTYHVDLLNERPASVPAKDVFCADDTAVQNEMQEKRLVHCDVNTTAEMRHLDLC